MYCIFLDYLFMHLFIVIYLASLLFAPGLKRIRIHIHDGSQDHGLVTVSLPLSMDGPDQTCTILSVIEAIEHKLDIVVAGA